MIFADFPVLILSRHGFVLTTWREFFLDVKRSVSFILLPTLRKLLETKLCYCWGTLPAP